MPRGGSRQVTRLFPEQGMLTQYYDWFKRAKHGEVLVYWTGDLQFDRDTGNYPEADAAQDILCKSLSGVADAILRDASKKGVILTQKRLGPSNYEYRATRNKPPRDADNSQRTRYGTLLPA